MLLPRSMSQWNLYISSCVSLIIIILSCHFLFCAVVLVSGLLLVQMQCHGERLQRCSSMWLSPSARRTGYLSKRREGGLVSDVEFMEPRGTGRGGCLECTLAMDSRNFYGPVAGFVLRRRITVRQPHHSLRAEGMMNWGGIDFGHKLTLYDALPGLPFRTGRSSSRVTESKSVG